MFDNAYKLALPPKIKVHPVFHISLLKEYFEDSVRLEYEHVSWPVSELIKNHEKYEVETILNKRKLRSRNTEYLVKRREYHVKEATWVPSSDLGNAKKVVQDFEGRAKFPEKAKGLMRASTPFRGERSRERNMSKIGITRCLSKCGA